MITVHHLADSRSQRILWLLEELELPYEVKRYEREPDGRAPKELLAIHPLGKSPVITHDGVTIAESGAIIEYLIEKYGNGKFKPKTDEGYRQDLYYKHYAEGSIMFVLVNKLIFTKIPQQSPWLIRPLVSLLFSQISAILLDPQIKRHAAMLEEHLSKAPWFSGEDELTTSDFLMVFPCEALVAGKFVDKDCAIARYAQKIESRPAYKKALEQGGEYKYLATA